MRTPVLVGVGVADQRGDDPTELADAVALMVSAARRAADDAGAPSLLRDVGHVAVPRGTWATRNPARRVARAIGATRARSLVVEVGIPQQTLVNDALCAIASGALDVALVVGGEAKRRDVLAARLGVVLPDGEDADEPDELDEPDERQVPESEIVARAEIDAGAVVPVQQYALIEHALRHAEGRTLIEDRDDIARMWARFNAVARRNPHAAFPEPRSASFLSRASPENRPLASPYHKWHATQWTVDQAAALLLCSVEVARGHGIPEDRWLYPLVALDSSHSVSLSRRAALHRWPAMGVLGRVAEAVLGRPLASVDHVELYSCFPSAVRVQQRELGLPLDGTPTITGGMAFAGGPFNNFVLQATAAMAGPLRAEPGTIGLVTTVSGLLTKPGLALWSAHRVDQPLIADLAARAAAATAVRESVTGYEGVATVATYTVVHERMEPARVVVIGDTPDGRRCVAACSDHEVAAQCLASDLVGARVHVSGPTFRP